MSSKKKILILSANPQNTARLRLDEEAREIEEGLRRSKYRDQFLIQSKWAIRIRDFRRAMLDNEPQIVHFCGHGEENGLKVEDDNGHAVLLNQDALAGLFEHFKDRVECVLLNACYSELQADAINEHISYVIGMSQGITDKAALEFAIGFYDALGAGKTVEEAFEFGRNAILLYNIPEHLTPILKKRANQNRQKENGQNILTKIVSTLLIDIVKGIKEYFIQKKEFTSNLVTIGVLIELYGIITKLVGYSNILKKTSDKNERAGLYHEFLHEMCKFMKCLENVNMTILDIYYPEVKEKLYESLRNDFTFLSAIEIAGDFSYSINHKDAQKVLSVINKINELKHTEVYKAAINDQDFYTHQTISFQKNIQKILVSLTETLNECRICIGELIRENWDFKELVLRD